jgi:hypothetical protein
MNNTKISVDSQRFRLEQPISRGGDLGHPRLTPIVAPNSIGQNRRQKGFWQMNNPKISVDSQRFCHEQPIQGAGISKGIRRAWRSFQSAIRRLASS